MFYKKDGQRRWCTAELQFAPSSTELFKATYLRRSIREICAIMETRKSTQRLISRFELEAGDPLLL